MEQALLLLHQPSQHRIPYHIIIIIIRGFAPRPIYTYCMLSSTFFLFPFSFPFSYSLADLTYFVVRQPFCHTIKQACWMDGISHVARAN